MQTTIDGGGRVVIPKPIRDHLGLGPGATVEVDERDGHVEIAPASADVILVEAVGGVAARSRQPLPPLTQDVVRETIERLRR